MQKAIVFLVFFQASLLFSQQSDFSYISFTKADIIAKNTKSRRLYELNKLTINLTKDLHTDVEKVRAIFKWICLNVANDFRLYAKNERKREKFKKDSLKLSEWNSELKTELFSRLLRRKKTICTGYAYLFKEMCSIAGIESKMIYGFGRTADVLEFDPAYPNHTWNAVKLNNKWYLCDATWAAGISLPERKKFTFKYNDGYFLTDPELFINNHYPIYPEDALLKKNIPTFEEFAQLPLIYGGAYKYFKNHNSPSKMYNELKVDTAFNFKYILKDNVEFKDVKLVFIKGIIEFSRKPEITKEENIISLNYWFRKTGYYDVHLYLNDEILATYIFNIKP
ncbi:MAG: hypothetical protein HWD82_06555 [Flavobacteriaceae bacterium]|nr:hypothetical protein [Flavobacteriaceae bacterium]